MYFFRYQNSVGNARLHRRRQGRVAVVQEIQGIGANKQSGGIFSGIVRNRGTLKVESAGRIAWEFSIAEILTNQATS